MAGSETIGWQWLRVQLNARPVRFALAAVLLTSFVCEPALAAQLEIVVPAYFYPSTGSDWNDLNAAAGTVPITAIMNPGNGPGNNVDSNYTAAVNSFRAAGGRVIGYVYSSYGQRSLSIVNADVDRYDSWYNIDGIFVDEMANTGPAEKLNYYKAIRDHAKAIDPNWEVMGNPGTHTIEQYLTWPTADKLMVFENVGIAYPNYTPSAWNFNHDAEHFVHLVHTQPSATTMLADLERAIAYNAGGIYVTDDVMNNPWDRLPVYWDQLVEAVALINADYNADGQIDASDYSVWRDSMGQTGARLPADGNGDGVVDQADYEHWKTRFGASAGAGAGGAAIAAPEPTTASFVALLVMLLAASLRRLPMVGG
jgi:hypothetical protein